MATTRDAAGQLMLGGLRLGAICDSGDWPTPFYIYDVDGIVAEARAMHAAFDGAPHLIAYAVKANTAGTIVRALAEADCGADVVSGAELEVALACGILPSKIVYSGVAKKDAEIDLAITAKNEGICAIQIESVEEILRVDARARALGKRSRVTLRFNPELDEIDTHAHISTGHDEAKFGVAAVDIPRAIDAFRAAKNIDLVGLTTHVGSQFTTTDEYLKGARALFALAHNMCNMHALTPRFLDVGGGYGIDYVGAGGVTPPADFIRAARKAQSELGFGDIPLFIEPGRSLVAAHAVIVSSVIQSKVTSSRRWLMIDAGMNDLIRPALYQARHRIVELSTSMSKATTPWRVVGPVCESSDDFGSHDLPEIPADRVAILDAGAYGFTMASQYNGRAIAAEVFLRAGKVAHVHAASTTEAWVKSRLDS
jgi:diaminopimelate decarboxylase